MTIANAGAANAQLGPVQTDVRPAAATRGVDVSALCGYIFKIRTHHILINRPREQNICYLLYCYVGPAFSKLVPHCINVIQMFCVCWDTTTTKLVWHVYAYHLTNLWINFVFFKSGGKWHLNFNKLNVSVFCKHKTFNKCWFNAGSAAQISGRSKHWGIRLWRIKNTTLFSTYVFITD